MIIDILDRTTNIVYYVCLAVVIIFAVVFIVLSALYFNAQKRLYENKIEDKKVQIVVDKDYDKLVKRGKKLNETIYKSYERKKGRERACSITWNVILLVIYAAIVGVLGWGTYNKVTGNLSFINNTSSLVIETESMESVNPNNTYLKDFDGDENRIHQYSYITITNDQGIIDSLSPYDIAAFKMPVMKDGKETSIIVVHRIIEIKNDNGKKLFTFRGDANPASLPEEVDVDANRIVGVYQSKNFKGYYNIGLGYFIVYIESPIGIITLVIALLLLVIYSILYERVSTCFDKRYLVLLKEKMENGNSSEAVLVESSEDKNSPAIITSPIILNEEIIRPAQVKKFLVENDDFYLIDDKEKHQLIARDSIYGMKEYHYVGKVNKGKIYFAINFLKKFTAIPFKGEWNYGFTLEDGADKIFKVERALRVRHDEQNRAFVYIKEDSYLTFIGDEDKEYDIYMRLFDNEFDINNYRWIVIYAKEKKEIVYDDKK